MTHDNALKNESRTQKSKRNMIFSFLNYSIRIVMSFIVRTIFIYKLGVEYLGLDSLFANILTLLSMAELGIGGAVVYSLYKPVAEKDDLKVKALLRFYKKVYFIIALIVLSIGLAIIPVIKYFISGNIPNDINIYIVYVIILTNTVMSYLCAHRRAIIYANQNYSIEKNISTICILCLDVFQIVLLLLFNNYYIYLTLKIVFSAIEIAIVYYVSGKLYGSFFKNAGLIDKQTKKEISKNTYAFMFHKLGYTALNGTDSIVISAFLGLTILGRYSNYFLIYTNVGAIISLFIESVKSSIGNLVVTKSSEEAYVVYKRLNYLLHWIVSFCAVCMLVLFKPFISLWVGEEYTFNIIVSVLLSVFFYIRFSRRINMAFIETNGLFWYTRYYPIIEVILNIGISIGLVFVMGVSGVILGSIISMFLVPFITEPATLFKRYFKKSPIKYFSNHFYYTAITIVSAVATYFSCLYIGDGILSFIAKLFICLFVPNLIFIFGTMKTKEMDWVMNSIKKIIKKKDKNKQE